MMNKILKDIIKEDIDTDPIVIAGEQEQLNNFIGITNLLQQPFRNCAEYGESLLKIQQHLNECVKLTKKSKLTTSEMKAYKGHIDTVQKYIQSIVGNRDYDNNIQSIAQHGKKLKEYFSSFDWVMKKHGFYSDL